jgi:hypothetical protein
MAIPAIEQGRNVMRIAAMYSFNNGEEFIAQQHRSELDEVLQIIELVDAEQCK